MVPSHQGHSELYDVLRMMRPPGARGFANETSTYGISGSFPHYKHVLMPPDQKDKLLAMHRASRANAGIYVAVVLGVYLVLLTMLLCRYAKRRPSSTDAASLLTAPPGIPPPTPERSRGLLSCVGCHFTCHLTPARLRSFCENLLCCHNNSPSSNDEDECESSQEIAHYPMRSLSPRMDRKARKGSDKPVAV